MKKLILAIGLFAIAQTADAQVGIGTATPNASAVLELSTTTKGFLPPRMTAAQRAAVGSPATGLLVYQTDGTAGLYYNSGTPAVPEWRMVSTGSYPGVTVYLIAAGTNNFTVPSSALGGLIIFDFNNTTATTTLTTTIPSPAIAGNGARIRFSYNRYNGNTYTATFVTPTGSIYPAAGTPGSSIVGILTSEFVSDGSNWREVPGL